jgi:hypothetical protein
VARKRVWGVFVGAALAAISAAALAGDLPADQRAKILMRVLTYDRQIESRQSGGAVFVGVLYAPADRASVKEKDAMVAALGALKALKIKGYSLEFAAMPYKDAGALKAQAGLRRITALYVCSGLSSALGDVRAFAEGAKVATMSGSEAYTRAGLAFAAVEKGGKGEIIVNLKAAKSQGLDLDAALLRLAVVLR